LNATKNIRFGKYALGISLSAALIFSGLTATSVSAAQTAKAKCSKLNQVIKGSSALDNLVCVKVLGKLVLQEQWKQPATLTLLVFKSPTINEAFWVSITAEARKQMPKLKFKYLYTPGLDRQAYARQLLTTNQLPDLIWDVPSEDFVKAHALLAYPESALKSFNGGETRIGGKVYGLPRGAQVIPLVYYNKSQFATAGITSTPKTWTEFLADCEKLKTAGFTPLLAAGAGDAWATPIMLQGMLNSDVMSKNPNFNQDYKSGKSSLSSDGLATFKKFENLVSKGYFNKDALSISYAQVKDKFETGGGAMYPMGTWEAAGVGKGFDIGVFPIPSDSGVASIGAVVAPAPFISAKTKFAAQALKAAIAIAASQDGADKTAKADALFPNVKGWTANSDLSNLFSQSFAIYVNSKRTATFGFNAGMDALPTGFMTDLQKATQAIMDGSKTAAQVVADLDASMKTNTAR
jgi:ABC-type glycerol-3-phosphate transport system substrate-binding protein